MAIKQFNLADGQRAERKTLITVAEWIEYTALATQPSDWATKYTDYYTKSGNVYTKIPTASEAPTFVANQYYEGTSQREILGTRTPDSSIDYNNDIETSTDIRGFNYTDLNKTQPQQDFDPYLVLGGSKLGAFLNDIRRRNAISELNQFTIYVITAFIGDETNGYEAERHVGCTITYNSIGGDSNVNFPISVYLSNNSVTGVVDVLNPNFEFTADV